MTQKEVTLDGGPPWGFRMHGGVDSTTPLKVSRVNPGSKAAQRGIREGDFITSINDLSTKNLTNNEAHNLLKNTGSSTLKLGLNKDIESSPKKTQYRTLHQETHEKTIKRSSVSYTLKETIERSSSRNPKNNEFISSNQGTKQNGSDVTIVTNIPVSQNSTSSSSSTPSTLVAEGKNKSSDHAIASRQSSYSNCSSIPDEGLDKAMNKDDEGKMSKSKKRRQRRKNLQNKQHDDVETTTIILHPSLDKLDILSLKRIEHKYKVESPKELKKLKAKSKSLDDDDLLNIQEVSEASENEDHTNIIISEASSEENLLDNELISPAEEQELRTFLDGLNLVNSPEESAKDLYERTSGVNDSKAKKIQKRKELEEYFMPIAQNPRYLDAISEEASDISDKECSSSLRHLKQGTPELNNNKVKSCIEEPILVETIKEDFVKADEAELVYLDDLSTSSSDFDEKSYDFQIDSEETISTEISSDVKVCSKILRPSKDGSSSKVVFDYTRIPNVLKPKEPEDEKELKNNEQKTITKSCMNGIKSENLENNDVKVLVGNTKEICEEKNESKTENTKEESIKITSTKCTTESKKESTLKQMIMTSNNKTDSQKLLEFKNIKMLNDEIKEKINRQELVGPLFRKSKSPSVSKELPGTSFVQRRVEEFSNVVEDNKVDNEEPDHSLVNSRIKAFSTSEGSILKRIILEEDSSNNINNNEEEKVIIEEQNKSETNHKEFIIPIEIEATNNGEERIIPIKIEKDVSVENHPRVSENSILNNFTEDTQDMNETLQYIIKEENPDNNFSKNLKHINESLQNIIENQPKEENRKNYKEIRIIPVEIIDNFKGEIEEFLKSNNLKHINESLQNIIENEEEQEEFEKSNKLKHINESLQNIIEKPSKAENNRERIIPVEIISNFKEELEEFKKSNNLKHINESLQNIMEKQPKEENEINNEEGIIPVEIINNSKEELGEIKKSNNLKHINESSQNIIEKQFKEENNKEKIISIEIINNSKEELEEFKKSNNLKHINESLQNMIEKQSKEASNEERIIPVEIINNSKEEFKKSNNESIKNIIENQPKKENQNKNQESDLKITNEPPVPPPRKSKAFLLRKTQKDTKIPVSNDITYTNILSPPRPASASSDSTTCSEESSRCTAKYNPNSSIADVASISEFYELKQPETLRNITLKLLISLPFGEEMLKVLADASCKTIENLIIHNNLFKEKMSQDSQEDRRLVELHEKFLTKNRLLTIIQEEDSTESSSSAKNLTEWLTLARNKSKSTSNLDSINNFNRFDVGKYPHTHTVQRRRSLPQEIYEKQLIEIMEKEREIQRELEQLEEEKRKLQQHKFQPDEFYVSKNGDFAERKDRPLSMPVFPTEFFRQQMYEEYMDKFSAREERKQQKLIKISSSSNDLHQNTKSKEIIHPIEIEQEFMDKVKEKFHKDVDEEKIETVATLKDSIIAPVLVLDGDKLKGVETLPKHLQEFVDDLTTMQQNNDSIWSPGHPRRPSSPTKYQRTQNDPQSPIWTPKSASTSPTVERKEFRPVNFQSPVLSRKTRTRSETIETPDSAVSEPPWSRIPEGISDNAINLSSTLDRRLPTSQSSPGFGNLSPRLPRAQNPTITLLQKAREGQLPRGAHYIADQDRRPPNDRPPIKYPGEVLYHIRNEYTSESDSEKPRKMADLSPRKFEGIGPVSKDGMPLILRSEVKDKDQSKWYKRMYDTIHKQKPHRDEYVTIRYKQKRAQYPYSSGYLSEPEPGAYDSDFTEYKYQTLDRRRTPQTVHFNSSTMNRNAPERSYSSSDVLKNTQPGRIENYRPGHSSISEKEAKQWWDEVMDIFDGHLEQQSRVPPQKPRSFINQALKESGYESDSTLVFKRKEETAASQISPKEQREAYKTIQKGGDVPFQGLRKLAPERPKEPDLPPPPPPPKNQGGVRSQEPESPRKYVENEVTIHYKSPVRTEIKEYVSEDELAHRQAEAMKKIYEEERKRKYLQELHDMKSRRHTDNFIPSQKPLIPLNRYDDFDDLAPTKTRPRSPEPRLVAKALYNFVGQTARELTFRRGDLIYVRRQVDKNWYEGELNAMVGLFPVNYVEIVPYEGTKSVIPRKAHEGQARAKFNFVAQTHLELSLAKGELVTITRKVDDNWFEGKIGGRKGIFPVAYVDVLIDPSEPAPSNTKPVASPAAHSLLLNGSASMGSHLYTPSIRDNGYHHAKPVQLSGSGTYSTLPKVSKSPVEALHIETQSEPIPYRALYKYTPQNDDELELLEGDTVYVLEKCDDGWYVGSSDRTGAFGTFPGNYVEKI
ncbi:unnamed protein product [Ceutorhynchus assimilis]|uniref:Uncharacterized protein n=1 Tax=Ceutorhynchus assimilis TaxID=467358 RepID=A0A9N9MY46_9CUCU|nr:unnamed protein product [Ceutorhynchus assimilis]